MPNSQLKWVYLILLSIIWGSSFILIKKSLVGLNPLQLGASRILMTAAVLFVVGFNSLKKIKKHEWKWVVLSGFLGTFFPAFLFAYAETEIDSAIASILNSSVPLLALIIGFFVFSRSLIKKQVIGVLIGLSGSIALILIGANVNPDQNYWYALLPILASLFYATNVNIIKAKMQNIPAMSIALGNFIALIIPAITILWYTDFFNGSFLSSEQTQISLGYLALLAVFGTAAAKVMFNKLVQISDPVFSSSVTYLMPIVSVGWGLLDNEKFTAWQFLAALVILVGVFLVNNNKDKQQEKQE
ncbi:DMT family transporter [Gangjinia marincola]|uniref:DMT family transporter n=1 Tax=Gangjinia marincola TaxID=578463 RepID=A0ABP3XW07_9FLAO